MGKRPKSYLARRFASTDYHVAFNCKLWSSAHNHILAFSGAEPEAIRDMSLGLLKAIGHLQGFSDLPLLP